MPTVATLLATWFGCGFSPAAPGTVGSLAALVIAWLLHYCCQWSPLHFALLAGALLVPAVWSAGTVARARGNKDPQMVVVDEVVGQWLALAGVVSWNWKAWTLALLLFRIFDITKPFPLRRLEHLPGGTGIVMDDVGAGVYTGLVLYALAWFNLY